ncbi:chitosanase [Staphylococcus epidermidis]|uniref:chitosanase n=1 Tax=Staphylococcus epidermidis TaxID=1282 RepID=UPI0003121F1F|nr:chitosanase [Staphylococcus epidermidis]MEB6269405.1 chitosanase [Staphylococcus epidermidis]QGY86786.1 chitosanase [Staphylococcus epidermidis]WHI63952.1 chitosanase [Staphylococcus epidermidis]CUY02268.1 Chitosanase precursor [Staphylococcus epidermidis]
MEYSKKSKTLKIVLGTGSTLLATLIAANGMGLANAAETHHHSEHQQTISPNSQNLAKEAQSKMAINNNNYMDQNFDLRKRCFALMGAAEDSQLDYDQNYNSVSGDISDGRGITAGIIGFTTGTGDMNNMLGYYNKISPNNHLAGYKDHMDHINGKQFEKDWHNAYKDDKDRFIKAQNHEVKKEVMNDAVKYAKKDGLSQLGQYIYFDALVKHGPGNNYQDAPREWGFQAIRHYAQENNVKTPAEGGDESKYLKNFVGKRYDATNDENDHNPDMDTDGTTDRLDFQMQQLDNGNLDLALPLSFKMNNTPFDLNQEKLNKLSDKDLASLND